MIFIFFFIFIAAAIAISVGLSIATRRKQGPGSETSALQSGTDALRPDQAASSAPAPDSGRHASQGPVAAAREH